MIAMELLTVMAIFIIVARSIYILLLYSEKSTFPLSEIAQPLIMLDGSPTFTSISFKSFFS
jgi:hypothetical protein